MDYKTFLATKETRIKANGFEVSEDEIAPELFNHQRDIVRWALRKGRAAIFADTGLGKTMMLTEWARLTSEHDGVAVLILAPLAVARQITREAENVLGVTVLYVRSMGEVHANPGQRLFITNYEMIEHFDADYFGGVVLDESSILKSLDGKTRVLLTKMFSNTSKKLCTTATPAPNDITEIGRHSEFLGVMPNAEMLAAFFINDQKMKDGTYRLKGHAVDKFYKWLTSWAIAIKRPSDIGYSDDGYILPPLNVEVHTVESEYTPDGMLPGFYVSNLSAVEAKKVRRKTVETRAQMAADMVNNSDEQWVIWCGLNDESDRLAEIIPDSVNVQGSMSPDRKADEIINFTTGKTRVLITKSSIAGFGINMQNCHNVIMFGVDYSWESYYQTVRRCWRFKQDHQVNVHIIISEQERSVFDTILNKESEAVKMSEEMVKRSQRYIEDELRGTQHEDWRYREDTTVGDNFVMMLGDSCERMAEIADNSIDLMIESPPFGAQLYVYSPTERDLGNSSDNDDFFNHYRIIIREKLRILKPGRNSCVHVQQIAATKINDGYIGIKDFRGDVIRAHIAEGWVFHGEVTIDKNPQVQAIRTKTKGLMFAQLHKDSAANRPAFADYMLIFQKPGENEVPVTPEVTNEEWIMLAHPVWYDIKESDTLNVEVARSDRDERHMCPLQLPVINNCVRLYSNRGETVFSPFGGIGSEGYEAVRLGRKSIAIELKPEYYKVAINNMRNAEAQSGMDLFTWAAQQHAANE